MLTKSSDMLNKNSLAVKNVRGQSEAAMVISDGTYVIQVKGFLIKCSTS